ncbi:MAG: hypothetical protein IKP04_07495, partial [Candidatus Methanomethylophilaceae archaeon]|nr:hypothetical protein [Candidatus Methanomethylophilaceae archaeon]
MNTKGMKFLAVLAVLAMAFAAFAVIAPAETDDAAATYNAGHITGTTTDIIAATSATELADNGIYYYTADATVTVTTGLKDVVLVAAPDVTLTFQASGTAASWEVAYLALLVGTAEVTGTNVDVTLTVKTGLNASPAIHAWDPASKTADSELAFNAATDAIKLKATTTGFSPVAGDYDADLYASTYTLEGTYGKLSTGAATTLTLINFTGVITGTTDTNNAKLSKFTGVVTTTGAGIASVTTWTSGELELTKGAMTLETNIPSGTLYVDAGASVGATEAFATNEGSISIKATGSFTIAGALKNKGTITNLGTFAGDFAIENATTGKITTGDGWTSAGVVTNNGSFVFKETTAESAVKFAPTSFGTVNNQISASKEVSGEISDDRYGYNQTVTVIGDTVINGELTLEGVLIINEGVTLTIADGGLINLKGSQSMLKNYGTIEIIGQVVDDIAPINAVKGTVLNYGTIEVGNASSAPIKDSITLGSADSVAFFYNYGVFDIEVGQMTIVGGKGVLVNKTGGSIIDEGTIKVTTAAATIYNAGSIKFDGPALINAAAVSKIAMINGAASVNIVTLALATNDFTIENAVKWFEKDTTAAYAPTNTITLPKQGIIDADPVNVLLYRLNIAPYAVNTGEPYYFTLSGNVSITDANFADTSATYTIGLAGSSDAKAVYIGDLIVQKGIMFSTAANTSLVFYGTSQMINGASASIANASETNEITVTGELMITTAKLSSSTEQGFAKINAAMYSVTMSAITVNYYKTLSAALADADIADDKTITTSGDNLVSSDLTIPAGVTVKNLGASAEITIKDGAKLTIADGGLLKNSGSVYVNGTMYAAVVKTGVSGTSTVYSDVKVLGAVDATWTSLASALESASAGDTIVITSNNVYLTKDTTVKAGVVLDTNEKNLFTYEAADKTDKTHKLTVNGTLVLYSAGTFKNYNNVVLNGYLVSDDKRTYITTELPGCYFEDQVNNVDYYYIAGIKNIGDIAASGITDIEVNGNVSVPTLSFAGADEKVNVTFNNDVEVPTITIGNAVVTFKAATIDATIASGSSSVALNGTIPATKTLKFTADKGLAVEGQFTTTAGKTGAFTVNGDVTLGDITVDKMKIAGTATTKKTLTVGKITVTGGLEILKGGKIDADYAMVTGAITTATDASASTIDNITIGSTTSAIAAAAKVDGKITAVAVVLFAGNTVGESIIENMKSTEFFVDGKLWFTVYSNSAVTLSKLSIPAVNGIADAESTELPGDLAIDGDGNLVGTFTPNNSTCNIAVDYEIYNITIITDAGIKAVYIDGKVLASPPSGTNNFELEGLKAGTYKV